MIFYTSLAPVNKPVEITQGDMVVFTSNDMVIVLKVVQNSVVKWLCKMLCSDGEVSESEFDLNYLEIR